MVSLRDLQNGEAERDKEEVGGFGHWLSRVIYWLQVFGLQFLGLGDTFLHFGLLRRWLVGFCFGSEDNRLLYDLETRD